MTTPYASNTHIQCNILQTGDINELMKRLNQLISLYTMINAFDTNDV